MVAPTQAGTELLHQMLDMETQRQVSVYPNLGRAYVSPAHRFSPSPHSVKTHMNYYGSLESLAQMIERGDLPEGTRFSTAAGERALERFYKEQGIDPREAEAFKDHMGTGTNGYVRCHTSTGLRTPKGWEGGRCDTGTGKYPRIVLIGNEEKGDIMVPHGGGLVIVEWDEVFGVASEVRDIPWPYEGFSTNWRFNPSPELDKISGHHDVAVGRGGGWHHDGLGRCLDAGASYGRWFADSFDGFRPVRGPLAEIESYKLVPMEYLPQL